MTLVAPAEYSEKVATFLRLTDPAGRTFVLAWCAECEREYWTPRPETLWTWLNEHRRFGLCWIAPE